jgi:hypothetical protein
MSKFQLLNVAVSSGRGATASKKSVITVDGPVIKFGKKVADEIKLGDEISLGLINAGQESRVYFLPAGFEGGTKYPVNGNSGAGGKRATMRYISSKEIVNALKLDNGQYEVVLDPEEQKYYVNFDATKPDRTDWAKNPRKQRETKEANQKIAADIKAKQAAKAGETETKPAEKPARPAAPSK